MELEDCFGDGKIRVWKETFAVTKSRRPLPNAFAVIQDGKEITVVADQSKIRLEDVIEVEKDWKILTLDVVLPFDTIGVTAKISDALAKAKVSMLLISAFSRDHFLVKEKDLEKAKEALRTIGLEVIEEKQDFEAPARRRLCYSDVFCVRENSL